MRKTHYCFIFEDITKETEQRVCQELIKIGLEAQKGDRIVMVICSLGGDPRAVYKIIDTLLDLKLPIITIGHQNVGSSATMLLAAGQLRLVTAGTKIFHHRIQVQYHIEDKFYDPQTLTNIAITLLTIAKESIAEEEQIWAIALRDSLLTVKKLKKLLQQIGDNDLCIAAKEAKKLKIVHDILPNIRALAAYLKKSKQIK